MNFARHIYTDSKIYPITHTFLCEKKLHFYNPHIDVSPYSLYRNAPTIRDIGSLMRSRTSEVKMITATLLQKTLKFFRKSWNPENLSEPEGFRPYFMNFIIHNLDSTNSLRGNLKNGANPLDFLLIILGNLNLFEVSHPNNDGADDTVTSILLSALAHTMNNTRHPFSYVHFLEILNIGTIIL